MIEKLESINIGIFGHIDHGKTTLLEKLTGKWTDTHSEELKRGITIKLGYANITIYRDEKEGYNIKGKGKAVRRVSFIDAPGHEMLMATTLSGAALIDAAILVIAANEGIKPQTHEHLMTLQAKNVENIIVVQNKIDLVSMEEAKKSCERIREFLGEHHKDSDIIPVSAQQRVNIGEVLEAIAGLSVKKRDDSKEPVFLIARSFDINRPGTRPQNLKGAVLGGTLKQGKLKAGEKIEIKPGRTVKENGEVKYLSIETKIIGFFKDSENLKELTPGGNASIETELDMSLGKSDLLAGNLASHVGKLPNLKSGIKIKFALFPKVFGISEKVDVEKIKKGETLMLSINTSITGGLVASVEEDIAKINLKVPAILFEKDNIGIARNVRGHWRLIGYGKVV